MKLKPTLISLYLYLAGTRIFSFLGPIPNIILFFPLIFFSNRIPYFKHSWMLTSSIAFAAFGSLFSEKPFLSLAFVAFIYITYLIIDQLCFYLEPLAFFKILLRISIVNSIVCLIQLNFPSFIVVPHVQNYSIPASAPILPNVPLLPRLSGLFIENGPMVGALIVITFYMIFSRRMGIVNLTDNAQRYLLYLVNLMTLVNIFLIVFTGSKLSILFLLVYLLYLAYFLLVPFASKIFRLLNTKFVIIMTFAFLSISLLVFSQIVANTDYHQFEFIEYIAKLQSLLRRLEIPEFSLFNGVGFGRTSDREIDSLNAIYIYSLSFGLFFGIGFLSFFSFFILYPFSHPVLSIILFVTYISSGSLLMFNYPLILITSRLLSSSHVPFSKSLYNCSYQ